MLGCLGWRRSIGLIPNPGIHTRTDADCHAKSSTFADAGTPGRCNGPPPVGFQKSATYAEQRLHATRSYSLIKPPRIGRRLMRWWVRSATGWVGSGGRRSQARWGRRPL